MPLPQLTGTLGKKRAAHLLRRATFGPTKQIIDNFASLTVPQAIIQLFQSIPIPEPPLDPSTGETWIGQNTDTDDADLQEYFKGWWIGEMLNSGTSVREKVVFFLHTHFTTNQEKVANSRFLYFQNALFRHFALDGGIDPEINFKELTKKICVDNAMLVLLDNRFNVRGALNENFAREFLELYTIGRGRAGQIPPTTEEGDYFYFTEQDVRAAAAVLSGYFTDDTLSVLDEDTDLPRGLVVSNGTTATLHDNDPKEFSNRFGNAIIQGDLTLMIGGLPTEESVLDELDQLVELIYAQPETALNICRKIYRFFVYYDITDTIENNIIVEMAATFQANGYKIEPVIRELLGSVHFYEATGATVIDDNFGAIIKSPLDLILGTLRFFEYVFPNYATETEEFYNTTNIVISAMQPQGLNLLNPFDVAGYEAYHQFPIFNRHWISTNSLTKRYQFIFETMRKDDMPPEGSIQIDLLAFMKLRFATNALNPPLLIRELVSYLFPLSEEGTEITIERLNYFEQQFLKLGAGLPQGALAFWQFSWSNTENIPASQADARGMLQDLINAMLQSPEYQLF